VETEFTTLAHKHGDRDNQKHETPTTLAWLSAEASFYAVAMKDKSDIRIYN
jgi:hypothetical protein